MTPEVAPRPAASPGESDFELPSGLAPALLLALLIAVAALVGPTIASVGSPGPDEVYYLSYGKTLLERGPGAIRDLFRVHVEEPRHWQFPNPFRVGFLAVAALWMRFDGVEPRSLAHLALASHLAAIALLFAFARRRWGEARALAGASLFAASPLLLGLSRRALQDNFALLASFVAVVAFLAALERPTRARLTGFAAAFAFAVLTKETAALLGFPFALWLAIEGGGGRLAPRVAWRVAGAGFAAGLVALAVWVAAAGSFELVRRLASIVVASPATNAYALRFGGGPWWRYVVDLVALSPGPTLLGIAGAALVLERARRDPRPASGGERFGLFLVLLTVATLAEFALLTKNVRYVAIVELPLRLLAVEALIGIAPLRSTRSRAVLVAVAVVALAALDLASFRDLFVSHALYDPMTAPLLELRGVVPGR